MQSCDLAPASGHLPVLRSVKAQVVVTIDHADLADLADLADPATGHGAATTGTGALVSAARARWAARDAAITRIVMGPDSTPIEPRPHPPRRPTLPHRALDARDHVCVFAGYQAPTWGCEAHPLLDRALDGPTDLQNSALLCERHHTEVHHGFRVERDDAAPPGRRWRTWRPDGTEVLLSGPPAGAA